MHSAAIKKGIWLNSQRYCAQFTAVIINWWPLSPSCPACKELNYYAYSNTGISYSTRITIVPYPIKTLTHGMWEAKNHLIPSLSPKWNKTEKLIFYYKYEAKMIKHSVHVHMMFLIIRLLFSLLVEIIFKRNNEQNFY